MSTIPFETFAPLTALDFIYHAFTLRTEADTKSERFQTRLLHEHGFDPTRCAGAEQPHGNGVACVDSSTITQSSAYPAVDALFTGETNLPLIIRCADCAAVFIVDRATPAIALIHSGKKGTQLNIVANTLAAMQRQLGTRAQNCRAVISPSIGPCHYEIDIWTGIETQLRDAGVSDIHNPRICTACNRDRYFSYRVEQGQTGRMFAMLALKHSSQGQ